LNIKQSVNNRMYIDYRWVRIKTVCIADAAYSIRFDFGAYTYYILYIYTTYIYTHTHIYIYVVYIKQQRYHFTV